jgi:hypothetical protein
MQRDYCLMFGIGLMKNTCKIILMNTATDLTEGLSEQMYLTDY